MELKIDFEKVGIENKEIMKYKDRVEKIHKNLHERASKEDDFVGWLELPTNYDKKEFKKIQAAAKRINKDSDILLVIGIGGSYLGARAVIEALSSSFYSMQALKQRRHSLVIFTGKRLINYKHCTKVNC